MMRAIAPLLGALVVLVASPANAQVTLGRLFSTPAERAQMEATRGGSATLLPNSQGTAPTPGIPGGPPPMSASGGVSGPPGIPAGLVGPSASGGTGGLPSGPVNLPSAPASLPGSPGDPAGAAPTGAPAGLPAAGAAGKPAGASSLTMSGVLRSSDNRTVVWLNGVPQPGLQNKLSNTKAGAPDLTVTLPSGRKITLKAGQRYDLNENRIKDVNEP